MSLLIRHFESITFRHSGLDPESSRNNIGALCAPLDTGLRRYDGLMDYLG